jgi:hypothetical protein
MRWFWYAVRFKFWLWWLVPGMRLRDAARYPTGIWGELDADPREDARSEMSYMGDG